ncbi:tetratricopeptide repeat protein [Sphingomonas ginsenosidivorax]|uniref:Tetratricopeptide repeat protein n=1 Tax=Sphingomonas ginsenosidivorax TaxID=862135 RepID=A0A5C6UCZ4_9SPHN|nr:2OG-Fe(II) oxygenase family protein [Sphingomonas ginsenosidivorax]TXC70603.1 tetratricopeptide repeat protein [Sphingomonas ginsenosidivorax]
MIPSAAMEQARQAKAAGDLRGAAALYARAAVERPDSTVAEHNLASTLGDLGDFAGAAAASARAIAKGSTAPETWLVHARALQGTGALDAAEAAFLRAIGRRPDYATAHRDLAQLRWMRTADVGAALAAIDSARVPALASVEAVVLLSAGEPARAAAVLDRAIARAPDAALHLLAANARAALGDAAGQLVQATAALRLAPASTDTAKAVVEALLHVGRIAEGAGLAERIAQAAPDDQGVIALLATAWRLLGDPRYTGLCEDPALISTRGIEVPPGWSSLDAFLADLAASLRERHAWRTHPLDQSLRHGSQTQEDLSQVDHPVLRALFAALDAPIRAHLAQLGTGGDPVRRRNTGGYRFAGAWSVLLRPGGYHTDHVHPRGWLSSAFHVDLPETVAQRPQGWLAFGRPGVPTTPALPPTRHVRPVPGQLILFPSYLWHGTEPFSGDAPRLTVAFDLLPG